MKILWGSKNTLIGHSDKTLSNSGGGNEVLLAQSSTALGKTRFLLGTWYLVGMTNQRT